VKEGSKAWVEKYGREENQRGYGFTMGLIGAGPGSFFFVSSFLRSRLV